MKRDFFEEVYDVVRLIPEGRVSTYGAIARFLDCSSARAVGWALKGAVDSGIPAHRVVNRRGELSGKLNFKTPTYMEEMLTAENIIIEAGKVKDFESYFWDPADNF